MKEGITEKHGSKGPGTARSNKSKHTIDRIWGTSGISIMAGGYFPYYSYLCSDQSFLWVKLCLDHTMGVQNHQDKSQQ
eukprot:11886083-Ditylum_brightwellii.AAC.1